MAKEQTPVTWKGELEHILRCPICLEIPEKPQILDCDHSLCQECIDLLLTHGKLDCPECRQITLAKNVRRNVQFKKAQQQYNKGNSKTVDQTDTRANSHQSLDFREIPLCELCETNRAKKTCCDCETIFCETCHKAHMKYSDCKIEDEEDVTTTVIRYKRALESESSKIDEKISHIQQELASKKQKYNTEGGETLATLKAAREEALLVVQEHFNQQEEKVKSYVAETSRKTEVTYENNLKKLEKCKQEIELFQNENSVNKIKKYPGVVKNVQAHMSQASCMTLPGFQIGIDRASTVPRIATIKTYERGLQMEELLEKHFTIARTFPLPSICNKLLVVKNQLWCFLKNVIQVRDSWTGELVKTIQAEVNMCCAAAVMKSGHIIVAAKNKGVLLINPITEESWIIAEGFYHSLTISESGQVIAIKEQGADIIAVSFYVQNGSTVNGERRMFKVDSTDKAALYTFAMSDGEYYFCCDQEDCIKKLDKSGKTVRRFGIPGRVLPQGLNQPAICDQNSGSLLITDWQNNKVKVLNPNIPRYPWSVVDIDGAVNGPRAALVTVDNLFITGDEPKMLYLCS